MHAIGHGLAEVEHLNQKHAVKQVDRLLSNNGLKVDELQALWVPFVISQWTEMVVVLDWTDFEKDDHATIALHMLTTHGRARPLLWKTVRKSEMRGHRNKHEDALLLRLRDIVPTEMKVTILADRGFGDRELYVGLGDIGFDFVIRFRGSIQVTSGDETRPAAEWTGPNGRARLVVDAQVTNAETPVAAVVCTKAKGMKDTCCLASSLRNTSAADIVKLYSRRFTIEENFRDTKHIRFGLGLSATRTSSTDRRDRLLLIGALAQALLTLLGAAGEATGQDKMLKANTSKKRTYSLFRQGLFWYRLLPGMRGDRLTMLMNEFGKQVRDHAALRAILGVI